MKTTLNNSLRTIGFGLIFLGMMFFQFKGELIQLAGG